MGVEFGRQSKALRNNGNRKKSKCCQREREDRLRQCATKCGWSSITASEKKSAKDLAARAQKRLKASVVFHLKLGNHQNALHVKRVTSGHVSNTSWLARVHATNIKREEKFNTRKERRSESRLILDENQMETTAADKGLRIKRPGKAPKDNNQK